MKTKTKTKTKTARANGVTLPGGYKVIGRAPNWDSEKHPVLEGTRGETHEIKMDEGTKKERIQRNTVVTSATLGAVTVWESATLRDFFDQTEDGDEVRIEYLGLGTAKRKGQNAPKLFAAAVKS